MAHNHLNYRGPGENIDVSQFLLREVDFINMNSHGPCNQHNLKKEMLVKNMQVSQQLALYNNHGINMNQPPLPTHSGVYAKVPVYMNESLSIKEEAAHDVADDDETSSSSPYNCDICHKSFKRKNYLSQHTRTHTGERPYKCEVCQKCFLEKHQLTKHTKTHSGERPHECPVCQKAFQEKHQLTKHSRTHTEERPFKCDICQKAFKEKHQLKKHTRTHTDERPYKCEICQKAFKEKHQLRKHSRTHNSDRPFKCDVCHKAFKEKHQLSIHMKTHVNVLESSAFSRAQIDDRSHNYNMCLKF